MRRLFRCLAALVLLMFSHQAMAHRVSHVHRHVNQVTHAHTRPHLSKHHRRVYHRTVHRHTHLAHRTARSRHFVQSRSRSLATIPPIPYVTLLPPRRSAEYADQRSAECMARVIYYEARGEGDVGMAAVGYVVMNRVTNASFSNSVCGVVGQSVVKRGKRLYQFSWAGSPPRIRSTATWQRAMAMARRVLQGTVPNPVGHALYFHVKTLHPRYDRGMYAMVLGNHKFLSPIPYTNQTTRT